VLISSVAPPALWSAATWIGRQAEK